MRFIRYAQDGKAGTALSRGEDFLDLGPVEIGEMLARDPQSLLDLAGQASGRTLRRDGLRILPPLARAPKYICVGLNYIDHAKESPYKDKPQYPSFFPRFASSIVGPEEPIVRPKVSSELDYEGELVAVLGRGGRYIPRSNALDHVFGYSIFNEASLRDYQFKSSQWTAGKNFDGTGAFGPVLVTADELPPGAAGLKLETRLNGKTVQSASTSDMIFPVAELVHLASEFMTLEPGDVIVTGTPAGVGFARKPQLFMKDGDVCEVEIEGIGILRNPIRNEASRS
jgi:2-keto-4-pentenoate hydratase/2-oxohepta-3-ene-1,7-dioic acid hydratase in catechol pathway